MEKNRTQKQNRKYTDLSFEKDTAYSMENTLFSTNGAGKPDVYF
jgi:hypothetical protein